MKGFYITAFLGIDAAAVSKGLADARKSLAAFVAKKPKRKGRK